MPGVSWSAEVCSLETFNAKMVNKKVGVLIRGSTLTLDLLFLTPFTRYRFHFISDCLNQSDMKISPVYTMPFSFHSGLGFCLHNTISPCTVIVSPYSEKISSFFAVAQERGVVAKISLDKTWQNLKLHGVKILKSSLFLACFSFCENVSCYGIFRLNFSGNIQDTVQRNS